MPGIILLQSFPREHRLLTPADFRRVFGKAQKSSDLYFTVLACARAPGQQVSRLGLAIAKKQLRRAVDRNRVKRLVREYFRKQVGPDSGMDFVVMARSAARNADNAQLNDSLDAHFRRLRSRGESTQA